MVKSSVAMVESSVAMTSYDRTLFNPVSRRAFISRFSHGWFDGWPEPAQYARVFRETRAKGHGGWPGDRQLIAFLNFPAR